MANILASLGFGCDSCFPSDCELSDCIRGWLGSTVFDVGNGNMWDRNDEGVRQIKAWFFHSTWKGSNGRWHSTYEVMIQYNGCMTFGSSLWEAI